MLSDLYLLETYFEHPYTLIYEEDLIEKYGPDPVRQAILKGWIEHRQIPCGKGRERCVCRLSDKGRKKVSVYS